MLLEGLAPKAACGKEAAGKLGGSAAQAASPTGAHEANLQHCIAQNELSAQGPTSEGPEATQSNDLAASSSVALF